MSRLVISPRHLQTINRHAAVSYPEECCGVLIGRSGASDSSGEAVVVERILSVGNEREDSRHNRYVISPETILAAQKEARARGLEIVGYYHSHPDHPARPSDFDREHAWPGLSYLIVSVEQGKVAAARSWRLADDRQRFDEEVVEPAAGQPAPAPALQKEAVQ
ncbi:MAG TPA: M67 family metallopeptidase [Thermoanaerobaculia bacterium]|nr:M67 family metallopeptidase [Thermoanaerobaculia bacterium]